MNTEISSRAATPQEKPLTGAGLPQVAGIMAQYADAGDKGVIGGYNGTFPLTTATKGNIYLLPSTGKYYRCITDYNGNSLSLPNANFEDLSVVKNADKLENLKGLFTRKILLNNVPFKLEPGFYLAILFHDGVATMTQASFFMITGNNSTNIGHTNEFYPCNNLSSNYDDTTFKVYYNPITCEIKTKSNHQKECLLIKFSTI